MKYSGTIFRYITWQFKALKLAKDLDKEYDFDLVHHVTIGSLTGSSQFWRLDKPFIFGPVGGGQIAPPSFKKYFLGDWPKEYIRNILTERFIGFHLPLKKMLVNSCLVLTANKETERLANQLGAIHLEMFSDTGLTKEYFPSKFPKRDLSKELRLIWVGRFFPRKALLLALEAIALAGNQIPLTLTIVGGGKQGKSLNVWLKNLNLNDKVNYLGFLNWSSVRDEYLNHDVMLFTSLRDSMGTQLFEAMATGLPIITLNHHGARDFVPESAGIKVSVVNPEETIEEMADAIVKMYCNPEMRSKMGFHGYEYSKSVIWEDKLRKISIKYEKVVGLANKNLNKK